MKVTSLISMTILILVLAFSCTPTKKVIFKEEKSIPNYPKELKKSPLPTPNNSNVVELQSFKLPNEKQDVKINQQSEKRKNYYQSTPDKYGNINDYRNIPSYDINNQPISVWFITDENKFVGFIVAGHATKAVCEVASLEVYNKLKAIGKDDATIFSFGVGYNLRKNHTSDNAYSNLLASMKDEFEDLASKHQKQVKVGSIDLNKYVSYLSKLKSHIHLANRSNQWTTHIVEYKLENFPLIAPFHYSPSSNIIQIRVPKSKFGKIPTELVYASHEKALSDGKDELNQKQQHNKIALNEIKNYSDPHDTETKTISFWTVEGDSYVNKQRALRGHRPPPDGYILTTIRNGHSTSRDITFKEAVSYLDDPSVQKDYSTIESLRFWIKQAKEDMREFRKQRKVLTEEIKAGNIELKKLEKEIDKRKAKLKSRDNQDYIIDAFLRGWVFETSNTSMNKKLDKWYATYRESVWDYMLTQVPNSRVNSKLGGIFHSDDVFFQVNSDGRDFIITPYKVVGGEFLQVIDKQLGISYVQSPFNFRFDK